MTRVVKSAFVRTRTYSAFCYGRASGVGTDREYTALTMLDEQARARVEVCTDTKLNVRYDRLLLSFACDTVRTRQL